MWCGDVTHFARIDSKHLPQLHCDRFNPLETGNCRGLYKHLNIQSNKETFLDISEEMFPRYYSHSGVCTKL